MSQMSRAYLDECFRELDRDPDYLHWLAVTTYRDYERKTEMGTVAKAAPDFEQIEPGTYPAICNAVIDLGVQDSPYGRRHQLLLRFEFPTEYIERDGQREPMVMSCFYTLSLSEKANLRRDLEAWRGQAFTEEELKGFDVKNVLGHPCTISVVAAKGGKSKVGGVSRPMKGAAEHQPHNELLYFDCEKHGEHSSEFARVPEWVQKIIQQRIKEDEDFGVGVSDDEHFADDVPF